MSITSDFSTTFSSWDIPVEASQNDRRILRELAQYVANAAAEPGNDELAELWKRHNMLERTRPLILARPENGWNELVPESELQCEDKRLREWEMMLRRYVFRRQHIPDDWPLPKYFNISWVMKWGTYGLEKEVHRTQEAGGSYKWDPPLKSVEDMPKLHFRSIEVDRRCTEYKVALASEIFGDVLPARIHGRVCVMVGLTEELAYLRGMEEFMTDFYDNPDLIHQIMSFLRDAKMHELDFYENEGLLSLNNESNDYIGQGGVGITDELPTDGFNDKVRLQDLWGTEASQEFTQVGPSQFREFAMTYQAPILKRFGLMSYGCCEPLDRKFEIIFESVPNLRRVSVSPWCDRQIAAEKLADKYLYAYKPNPALICGPEPFYDAAEKQLRETMEIARHCHLEVIMKDTHTFHNDPSRITHWTLMAKKLADQYE